MCWTRHFYELEAVVEAFHAAAGAFKDPARKTKLAFWAHELWVSEEYEVLLGALQKAWLRHGYGDSQRAPEAAATATATTTLDLLGSLQSLRAFPAPYPPPRSAVAATSVAEWPAEAKEELRRAVRDAVARGRTERVLRLLGGHPLRVAAEYLGVPYKSGVGLLHMLGTLGLRRHSDGASSAAATATATAKWPQLPVGRLGARLFARPVSEVVMEPSGVAVVDGCAFWRRVLVERGCDVAASRERGHLVFPTEDAFEAFYEEFFPDDIPDEWTAAEREKSHVVASHQV